MGIFSPDQLDLAARAITTARKFNLRIVTVETCTGGLLSACLTEIPGSAAIFERGFTLYHDCANPVALSVAESLSSLHGVVSAEVTQGLAEGVYRHSSAGISLAITGYAGPEGGSARNPVGTVFIASARRGRPTLIERHTLPGDRDAIRAAAVTAGLTMLVRQAG